MKPYLILCLFSQKFTIGNSLFIFHHNLIKNSHYLKIFRSLFIMMFVLIVCEIKISFQMMDLKNPFLFLVVHYLQQKINAITNASLQGMLFQIYTYATLKRSLILKCWKFVLSNIFWTSMLPVINNGIIYLSASDQCCIWWKVSHKKIMGTLLTSTI